MKEINKYIDARGADIYNMPIQDRIDWLVDLSKQHSAVYCTPEAYLSRKRYSTKHPTMVIALKCMDGRIHLPYATKTPLGIIKPFRNIGGMFDLGWPYLGEVLYNTVNNAIEDSQRVLMIITYHFSKGDQKRGCAGFNHDCNAAVTNASNELLEALLLGFVQARRGLVEQKKRRPRGHGATNLDQFPETMG